MAIRTNEQYRQTGRVLRFRLFLERHKIGLMVLGSLVMGATFLVKEVWREDVRQKAELVRSTVNEMSRRQDAQNLEANHVESKIDLNQIEMNQLGQGKESAVTFWDAYVPVLHHSLDNLNGMLAVVDDNDVSAKEKTIVNTLGEYDQSQEKIKSAAPPKYRSSGDEFMFGIIFLESRKMLDDIRALQSTIMLKAASLEQGYENSDRLSTRFVYFLFGLGFILALIPPLFGVEVPKGAGG
jgi:hypothetical protein